MTSSLRYPRLTTETSKPVKRLRPSPEGHFHATEASRGGRQVVDRFLKNGAPNPRFRKNKNPRNQVVTGVQLAESKRFELLNGFPRYTISNRAEPFPLLSHTNLNHHFKVICNHSVSLKITSILVQVVDRW